MSDGVDLNIQGLDQAVDKIRTLAPKLQKKGLRSAARKAMGIVRKAAQDKAPVRSGNLKKNIVTRVNTRRSKEEGGVVMQVGIRGGARQYKDTKENRRSGRVGKSYEGAGNAFYWRFSEFGTQKQPAAPFMRPALANNVEPVTDTFARELSSEIDKVVAGGS